MFTVCSSLLRVPAIALAVVLTGMAAGGIASAAAPAAEQTQVHATQQVRSGLSDPAAAKVNADGLLPNGVVANGGSYG